MAKAALKASASVTSIASAKPEPEIDEKAARAAIEAIGERMRGEEDTANKATGIIKATKAESMKMFTGFAEKGFINLDNFSDFFLMWRYPAAKRPNKVAREHAAEETRFRRSVICGMQYSAIGKSFVSIADEVIATTAKMRKARKDASKDEKSALPVAKKPETALYKVMLEVAKNKNRPLTADEMLAAITVAPPPAVTFATKIKDQLDEVNLMLDAEKAKKAKLTVPTTEISNLRKLRDMLEDMQERALKAAERAEETGETEEEETEE